MSKFSAVSLRHVSKFGSAIFVHNQSVDSQDGTGNVIGLIRTQKRSRLADVLDRPHASPGKLGAFLDDDVVTEDRPLSGRVDPSRLDGIHVDLMPGQLDGDRSAQMI